MADSSTRSWTRPHDWAEVLLGVVAVLSPLWMDTDNLAMWTLIIGALTLVVGAVALPVANEAHRMAGSH